MNMNKRLFYSNNLRAGPIGILPPGTGTAIVAEDGTVLVDESGNVIIAESNP